LPELQSFPVKTDCATAKKLDLMGIHLLASFALAAFFVWLATGGTRFVGYLLFFTTLASSILAVGLEVLSLFQAVTLATIRVVIFWSFLMSGAATFYFRRYLVHPHQATIANPPNGQPLAFSIASCWNFHTLVCLLLFIVLMSTAFTAISSVPNTWDSMTYHLPRIEHWLQNRSLRFFPTSNGRQLEFAILAEELILSLRSIYDSYPCANLVQWLARIIHQA
jgi:hypothetical protein